MTFEPSVRFSPALDLGFPADESVSARVIARLDDFSPSAIHELGPDEAPVWRVFFATPAARDEAARTLAAEFTQGGLECGRTDVPDGDWAARSQADLRAVRVGRIVVAPPWDVPRTQMAPGLGHEASGIDGGRPPADHAADDVVIVIQPSMGFGTGHHETTRLCLALLQEAGVAGRDVLDVGTGSGVLALAAGLLGARSIRAVDVDEDALAAARENAVLNAAALAAAGARVDIAVADVRDGLPAADLVIANLTGGLLVSAAGALARAVGPDGALLVSGFQRREADVVLAALAPTGAVVVGRAEGDWEAALIRM